MEDRPEGLSYPGLLVGVGPPPVGSADLAMREARVRSRVERKMIEQRNVVGIDAIAQRRRVGETGDQHACQRAEPDVHYIVDRTAAAEGPAGVIATQRTQPVLA